MSFWDTSAVVPLCTSEEHSPAAQALREPGAGIVVWWGTPVECQSAFARLRHAGSLAPEGEQHALRALDRLAKEWIEIAPTEVVRERARRLVRRYVLKAADAFQLAAALDWVDDQARGHAFVTFDERLSAAARAEGFSVAGREE